MFTHLLPNDEKLFAVYFCEYAQKHFLKKFQKKYKGLQWEMTENSIRQELIHISNGVSDLQQTSRIDELWHNGEALWLFKFDFRIAKTQVSFKASGNRVVGLLDAKQHRIEILTIYAKTDLPSNISETSFAKSVVREVHPEIEWR